MNYIGHLLVCYEKFSAAFASSEEMLSLLVESYKNIICFWQKAAKLFSRKGKYMMIRNSCCIGLWL